MKTLLIVDDDAAIRGAVKLALLGEGYEILEAATVTEAEETLRLGVVDCLLIDVHFGGGETCHALLKRLTEASILPPTVVLSGAATAKEAADAIRFGAYDYIEKPPSAERLRVALKRCLEHAELRQAYEQITRGPDHGTQLLGTSPPILQVKRLVEQFGPKDVKVLITGATGTGKEVAAHALWRVSPRRSKPFIVVNCAAVPENLIESELFGHRKGSFTGATANQMGKIEMAAGGTLFLDEIGELTPAAQSKLLRFLETSEIQPVGAAQTKSCDVRLIAATSRDLEREVKRGRFREDLYYRLNVARIELSPLAARSSDVVPLFHHFLERFSRKYGDPVKHVEVGAAEVLTGHGWPGNVRELRNIAERASLLPGETLTATDAQALVGGPSAVERGRDRGFGSASLDELPFGLTDIVPFRDFKRLAEARYIALALAAANGSVARAAEQLKLDRTYLHQKINQLGLKGERNE